MRRILKQRHELEVDPQDVEVVRGRVVFFGTGAYASLVSVWSQD